MPNVNKVFLMGHLTRDPELKYLQSGKAVANFGIAVNEEWKDSEGNKKSKTCFVDLVIWGKRAEVCAEYLQKGSPLFVEGKLQLDTWEKDGQKNSKLKVVVNDFQFIGQKQEKAEGDHPPDGHVSDDDRDPPF